MKYNHDQSGRGKYLKHYGMPRRSGRYPWGSGKKPQRNRSIYNVYKQLHEDGFTDAEIAKKWGMSQNKLKIIRSLGRDEERKLKIERAEALQKKGYSLNEIAKRIGVPNESTVRSLLNPTRKARNSLTEQTANIVKDFCDKHKYIDIGEGTEIALGINPSRMEKVVEHLKFKGYSTHTLYVDQMGTNYQTTISCLVAPGVSYKELRDHYHEVVPVSDTIEGIDGVKRPVDFNMPVNNISSDRVAVRYAEEGGKDRDGLIEIRRGCPDLNLGKASYAQVRIGIDGTHYAKGMCIYGDDSHFPPGCDILVHSNKNEGTPLCGPKDNTVLKLQKSDPRNPFGASIKDDEKLQMVRKEYQDPETGETKISGLNIVNEEGDWDRWRKTLSSQFLSKQRPELAKTQLDIKYSESAEEFDEICKLTNPTVKKVLLEKFADQCDGAAQDLKAAALPNQAAHVILPCPSLKPNEIYAPKYKDGTNVILVRHPHASITEIPQLVVNNRNKEAIEMIGKTPTDAVCIHPAAAQQMSGADFDGDSVLVIPANNPGGKVRIKTEKQYKDLVGFETSEYAFPPGYTPVGTELMSEKAKGKQMGVVSNLISDMNLKGAPEEHMVRAIKHSMVVIDAPKHELDWKRSERENDIAELKRLYQERIDPDSGEVKYGGASTIISRAKSKMEVPDRKAVTRIIEYKVDPVTGKVTGNTDPETGKIIQRPTGESFMYINEKVKIGMNDDGTPKYKTKKLSVITDWKTGKQFTVDPITKERTYRSAEEIATRAKVQGRTQWSTRMAETQDAFELTSGGSKKDPGTPMEGVYANYANQMKDLANKARKEYLATPNLKQNNAARREYAAEYDQLCKDLLVAKANAPKERRAQILANREIDLFKADNPDVDYEHLKKAKGRAIQEARKVVGAKKPKINITPREWEAIQKGVLSDSTLRDILNNADLDQVRAYAMPRQKKKELPATKITLIKTLSKTFTQEQIAERLNISVSAVSKAINS